MKEKYYALKREITTFLQQCAHRLDSEAAVELYYDIAEVSDEDGIEFAFDLISNAGGKDDVYMEESFLENVYERFHRNSTQTNIDSLYRRIEANRDKPAVNTIYRQLLAQLPPERDSRKR